MIWHCRSEFETWSSQSDFAMQCRLTLILQEFVVCSVFSALEYSPEQHQGAHHCAFVVEGKVRCTLGDLADNTAVSLMRQKCTRCKPQGVATVTSGCCVDNAFVFGGNWFRTVSQLIWSTAFRPLSTTTRRRSPVIRQQDLSMWKLFESIASRTGWPAVWFSPKHSFWYNIISTPPFSLAPIFLAKLKHSAQKAEVFQLSRYLRSYSAKYPDHF